MKTIIPTYNQRFTKWAVTLFQILSMFLFLVANSSCSESDDPKPEDPRFVEQIFSRVLESGEIVYGVNSEYHTLRVYTPVNDHLAKRPLILLFPGGAFATQERDNINILRLRGLAMDLAERGYVSALVNYTTVGDDGVDAENTDIDELYSIFWQGMMDQKAAVRFFRKHQEEYGIDTENIFIGGWSTGATISLMTAYVNDVSEIDKLSDAKTRDAAINSLNLFGLEGQSGNEGYSSSVKGVVSLMGTLPEVKLIDANESALMLIHHTESKNANLSSNFVEHTFEMADGTYSSYGSKNMLDRAMEVGYEVNQNLHFVFPEEIGEDWTTFSPNISNLSSDHYDAIALFLFANL